jgi:hypothetical protein
VVSVLATGSKSRVQTRPRRYKSAAHLPSDGKQNRGSHVLRFYGK